ncbi:DUF1566 domain-containing protein [Burkholderia gladioli]|uniref:DUF1566 domain-containing protein n=1 Tax=Burkholderia gladioli TaxID=28095 RepID=UPI00163E9C71|nr:DUF1566 domain-containing protein [Burkholderia gladioli]
MNITLASIEAEHARISALIEQFKKQPAPPELRIPAVTIPLAAGERLAGAILNDDGAIAHYTILLPGDADDVTWPGAKDWAAQQGGELPTRREQSLLFTNLRDEFESAWYWSAEAHESNSGWAWCQGFGLGTQYGTHQGYEFRARAVRRFIPSVI